jgi:hypothetical protein
MMDRATPVALRPRLFAKSPCVKCRGREGSVQGVMNERMNIRG